VDFLAKNMQLKFDYFIA